MTKAIVFVDPDRLLPNASICLNYCIALGYHVVGVVRGSWDEVIKMTGSRKAEVVVVAEDCDLPADRTPRVEIVAHETPAAGTGVAKPPGSRRDTRTRVIRRIAGA